MTGLGFVYGMVMGALIGGAVVYRFTEGGRR